MITFSPDYAPYFFRFFITLVIIDCIQHIVIIYFRDSTFCYISLQVLSTPLSSRQLNGLNWYFQLSFPCVGRSSILLVLVELLEVCPSLWAFYRSSGDSSIVCIPTLRLSLFWFFFFWDFSLSSCCNCPEICPLYQASKTAGVHQHDDRRDLPLDESPQNSGNSVLLHSSQCPSPFQAPESAYCLSHVNKTNEFFTHIFLLLIILVYPLYDLGINIAYFQISK